jgi:hypothetical protein
MKNTPGVMSQRGYRGTRPKKPSRRDFLTVIERCQHLFGAIEGVFNDDRNPMRADKLLTLTKEGFELCLSARSLDPS